MQWHFFSLQGTEFGIEPVISKPKYRTASNLLQCFRNSDRGCGRPFLWLALSPLLLETGQLATALRPSAPSSEAQSAAVPPAKSNKSTLPIAIAANGRKEGEKERGRGAVLGSEGQCEEDEEEEEGGIEGQFRHSERKKERRTS